MRASTSGAEGSMFDASTRASAAAARNCVSASSSTCSPMRCSRSARSSASVSNSLAERASSSSSGGQDLLLHLLERRSRRCPSGRRRVRIRPAWSRPPTCRGSPPRSPRARGRRRPRRRSRAAPRRRAGPGRRRRCPRPGQACRRAPSSATAKRSASICWSTTSGRDVGARVRNLEPLPVGDLDRRLDVHGGREAEVLVRCVRQLVVVFRTGNGPNPRPDERVADTSPRCGSRPPPSTAAPCRCARAAPASAPSPCGSRGSSRTWRDRKPRARPRAARRGLGRRPSGGPCSRAAPRRERTSGPS